MCVCDCCQVADGPLLAGQHVRVGHGHLQLHRAEAVCASVVPSSVVTGSTVCGTAESLRPRQFHHRCGHICNCIIRGPPRGARATVYAAAMELTPRTHTASGRTGSWISSSSAGAVRTTVPLQAMGFDATAAAAHECPCAPHLHTLLPSDYLCHRLHLCHRLQVRRHARDWRGRRRRVHARPRVRRLLPRPMPYRHTGRIHLAVPRHCCEEEAIF